MDTKKTRRLILNDDSTGQTASYKAPVERSDLYAHGRQGREDGRHDVERRSRREMAQEYFAVVLDAHQAGFLVFAKHAIEFRQHRVVVGVTLRE